jgi:hypothetical protein
VVRGKHPDAAADLGDAGEAQRRDLLSEHVAEGKGGSVAWTAVGKVFDEITGHLQDWVGRQSMFFVATAPLAGDGLVNVSPKGPIGSLRIVDPHTVAYLDVTGSGAETIAHLRENGRIVIMLCAFDGPPRIVRFHGTGTVLRWDEPGFEAAAAGLEHPSIEEARRSVVTVAVTRVSDSCGYGVPLMEFTGMREHHALSSAKKLRTMGAEGYAEYLRTKNARSLDGLPAV